MATERKGVNRMGMCPFKDKIGCKSNCALYVKGMCSIVMIAKELEGLKNHLYNISTKMDELEKKS